MLESHVSLVAVPRPDNKTQLRPGDILGGYQLLLPVGAGGMGRVWAARRHGVANQNIVALKTTIDEMVGDREFERILLDEARIASSIVHPNVCAIRELGAERGIPYLVMDWVDAGTLLDVIGESPDRRIDIFVAARIIADVAAGLHAAHELVGTDGNLLNVVHRDVSPQNILLSSNGHVKVADFGVARARGQLHKPTETGELKGKLSYMAPEQLTSKDFDRRADVFALGCCLYEATTGQRPFHGGDALETMYKLLETECVTPTSIVAAYPKELESLVLQTLEKDPAKRYQTAEDLRVALEAFLARNGRLVTDRDVALLVKATLQPTLDRNNKALADATRAFSEQKNELRASPPQAALPEIATAPSSAKTPRTWSTHRSTDLTRSRIRLVAIGALIAAGIVVVSLWPKTERQSSQVTSSASTGSATPMPAIQRVSITLRTDPPGADLRIDDGPSNLSPLSMDVVPNSRVRVVTASLSGYETQRREVVFDHEQDIIIGLKAQVAKPATISTGSAKPARLPISASDPTGNKNRRSTRQLDQSNPFEH
jgi:eukaryotic-like serine/threonine-protein kinase